ncbi:MAG TPA: DUF1178 family protein [Acetobacteraceae bacterium]|nr:DUF1178 family protein [Acetobacteraceae bacterium]
MIHYQLQCKNGHAFDGWFKDSATFDAQAARGLIECPACSTVEVSRAMMAPAVTKRMAERPPPSASAQEPSAPAPAPPVRTEGSAVPMPDQVRAALQRLRAEIEARCDHVGDRFAEEALRIHRGEAQARAIYGDATQEEAEQLAEEGVSVARIPWVPRAEG